MCGGIPIFHLYNGNTYIAGIQFYGGGCGIDLFGEEDSDHGNIGLANNMYYKLLFEVELTGTKWNIALFINGIKKIDITCDSSKTVITKVCVCGNSYKNRGMISNIIIADVDCSNERIAICNLASNNDVLNVDTDALMAEMTKYVNMPAITSLQVGASNIEVASSDISSIKETLNSTDISTKSINAQKGVIFSNMAANPLTGNDWTIQGLKNIKFNLSGVKA